jgi:hypothetical protein
VLAEPLPRGILISEHLEVILVANLLAGVGRSCEGLLHSLERMVLSVLHLDPVRLPSATVRPITAFRYQPLQAHVTSGPE